MASFPVGVSTITWQANAMGFDVPVVVGTTTTIPDKVDDPTDVWARSTLSVPSCDDGNPFTFEIRGNASVGAGLASFSIGVGDPGTDSYFFSGNLAVWPAGNYETVDCVGPGIQSSTFYPGGGDSYVEWSLDNIDPGVEVSGTDPVAFRLGWDHETQIAYLDWDGTTYTSSVHDWDIFTDGVWYIGLRDESSNTSYEVCDPPHGPFDAQLTNLEIEITDTSCVAATGFSVRDVSIEVCGAGPCAS